MTQSTVDRLTQILVAQYLAKNAHEASLSQFLQETGLPRSAVEAAEYEALEKVVAERVEYNESALASQLAQNSLNNAMPELDPCFGVRAWDYTQRSVTIPMEKKPTSMAIDVQFGAGAGPLVGYLTASTAARTVSFYDRDLHVLRELQSTSGVVKKCGVLAGSSFYYTCGFDGSICVYNASFERTLQHQLHARIITDIQFFQVEGRARYLCFSCGLDNYVRLHSLDLDSLSVELHDSYKLITPCTSFQLAQEPVQKLPLLLLTRLDFSHILVLGARDGKLMEVSKIAMNSAQFSAHSFNARSICLLNLQKATDSMGSNKHLVPIQKGTMVAVATSHTPFMRLILLEMPDFSNLCEFNDANPEIYYDKVLRNMTTTIAQDQFSQPIVKAFPHASGLLVGCDSGIYAVDLSNCDTWQTVPGDKRVKALDVCDNRIAASYAGGDLEVWCFETR
ncbi:LAQU0S04e03224g1_1 [Lachancea quebecensis]|uniref:LAQU0S04e03224g1_1 n=1 Tax=Lachancea quebecensis TaxID=1654605 RepID=A0A0N7MLC4_9SACH|nr:LAQU0S04e03224g1_1 [Lachancea quebecensis]